MKRLPSTACAGHNSESTPGHPLPQGARVSAVAREWRFPSTNRWPDAETDASGHREEYKGVYTTILFSCFPCVFSCSLTFFVYVINEYYRMVTMAMTNGKKRLAACDISRCTRDIGTPEMGTPRPRITRDMGTGVPKISSDMGTEGP